MTDDRSLEDSKLERTAQLITDAAITWLPVWGSVLWAFLIAHVIVPGEQSNAATVLLFGTVFSCMLFSISQSLSKEYPKAIAFKKPEQLASAFVASILIDALAIRLYELIV